MTKQEFKLAFNEVLTDSILNQDLPERGVSGWSEVQKRVVKKLIREAQTRSELSELLRTEFSTKLLDGYIEHKVLWPQVFDLINITKKDVDLPGLKGIHVWEISSGEEKKFIGPTSGEATLEPKKYACLLGFTEEMLEDCEIDLMGWCLRMVGHRFKQKEDEIAFTAFTTRGGSMNANTTTTLSAAALQSALAILMNRTVTSQGYTERDPITPDTLIVDPTHLYTARELIHTTLTVTANLGGTTAAGGTNVLQNVLNIVVTPYIDDDYYYIGKAKVFGGALFCRRKQLEVKNWEDLLRDTENVRAKARWTADIVEPNKWVRTAY